MENVLFDVASRILDLASSESYRFDVHGMALLAAVSELS